MSETTPVPEAKKGLKALSTDDFPMRKKGKFAMPNLANATVSGLVDQVGSLRAWKSYVDSYEKALMEALKARAKGAGSGSGDYYEYSSETVSQVRISADLAREVLDEETLAKISNTISFSTTWFSPKE